jgi:hypothetical protein
MGWLKKAAEDQSGSGTEMSLSQEGNEPDLLLPDENDDFGVGMELSEL